MDHPRRVHFTAIALGTIATIGLWEGARGVVLPHFLAEHAFSPAVGAAIFSASAIGGFAGSLSFGALSQRFGLRRLVAAGAALAAAMLALFLLLGNPIWLYASYLFYGLGFSMLELSTSLPISLLYAERQGSMLNFLHGCFGVGALSGSMLGAALLGLGFGWRAPIILLGVLLIIWGTAFVAQPTLPLPRSETQEGGYGPLLRDPLVWAAALALGAAVAGEVGAGLWIPSYLQQVKGLPEAASALGVTLYFGGFTATRLAGGWLVARFGSARAVVALAAVGAVGLIGFLTLPGGFAWLAALAGAGVAIGFATCIALVATRHPSRVNQVYGLMYATGGLAGIVTGPLLGIIGERAGLTAAMWSMLVCYAAIIGLISLFGRANRAVTSPG